MRQATITAPTASDASRRKLIVMLGCYLAGLVFVSTIALLCWQWTKHENPDAMVIVQGQKGVDGIVVQVIPMDPSATAPPQTDLTKRDGYRARIHMAAGKYRLQIRHNDLLVLDRVIDARANAPFFAEMSAPSTRPNNPLP